VTAVARLALANLSRARSRTLVRLVVLATATALLGSMLLFVGDSLKQMSASAVRGVPVDWQGPVNSDQAAKAVAVRTAAQPGVLEAVPTATAPLAGASTVSSKGTTSAGSGSVLAVPPGYGREISTFRMLQGSLRQGQVVLDQQMAATLRAHIGGKVRLRATLRSPPVAYTVSGVAVVTAPDVLFQPLDPQLGPAPAQPPANVAILPLDTFAQTYAPNLRSLNAANVGSSVQPGAQDAVQWQVQAKLDPRPLSAGSPTKAYRLENQTRNRVERSLPGQVQFVDNLGDHLQTAAGDALYAEALYILLAVPGALIALGLAYLAALGTVERDRRDLALLRARGASRRDLLGLALIESTALGAAAGVAGAALAVGAVGALVPAGVHFTLARIALVGGACILLAIAGAAAARIGAAASVLRSSVVDSRRSARRTGRPLWQLLYVDVACLAVSGLVYWLTVRSGFSAVINPDSNPTLSLSVYMFFAPALLWIGATLLLVRLRGRILSWAALRASGGRATSGPAFLLSSAGRRGAAINRGLVIVGLLLAFAVSLGIFTATWDQQANIDAQLTLGADVVATAPPGTIAKGDLAHRIDRVPGVTATTALDHSYAYVGPDLQDTYGIDPSSFTRATTLRDSYFLGDSASGAMAKLRSTPDGILVSKETITDYALKQGDLLKLRVLDRSSGRFHVVPFHVAGTVQEFPSAPKDSFMVTNLAHLERASHGDGPNVVFAKATDDPVAVAQRVRQATARDGTVVKDIGEQTAQTVSSITTVNLDDISRIEEIFSVVLAAGAMALFVSLAVAERRQEFATMAAVGASLRRIGAFLWSEAGFVLVAAALLAAGLGWLLAKMLVAMLTHAFDPPPDHLAIPWAFLGELSAATLAATVIAIAIAARSLRRLSLGAILREQ
jgi:putative ABC transport system permease protein